MELPSWYIEQAQDYISILRSSEMYSEKELSRATESQRLAEYKLMKMKMNSNHVKIKESSSNKTVIELKTYPNNALYDGYQNFRARNNGDQTDSWSSVFGTKTHTHSVAKSQEFARAPSHPLQRIKRNFT